MNPTGDEQAQAADAGIDMSLIAMSLQRTYDERARDHQSALELAEHLRMIGLRQRATAQSPIEDPLRR
jgi:hypothetical protein